MYDEDRQYPKIGTENYVTNVYKKNDHPGSITD